MYKNAFFLAHVLVYVQNISGGRNKKLVMEAASGTGAPGREGDVCFIAFLFMLFDIFTMYMNYFFN